MITFPAPRPSAGRRLLSVLLAAMLSLPLSAEITADFGPAILETWVQPQYPEAARKAKQEGEVTVEFVVEADGTVTRERVAESTDAVFDEAALAAVRRWHFKPALEDAKPAASAVRAPVKFSLQQLRQKQPPVMPEQADLPVPLKVEPARAEGGLDTEYPSEIEQSMVPGLVRIRFTVTPEGAAVSPQVLFASHPAFVETALRTLERAKFVPARQGPLTRADTMEYPVSFQSFGTKRAEILAANRLEVVGDATALPQPVMLLQPVYPRERLLAGESATVAAEFTVQPDGQTGDVVLLNPTGTDFEAALRAAIESWAFQPAKGDDGPVAVRLRVTHEFSTGVAESRLRELLQPGGAGVPGPSGLDQKLKPLWRGFPVYPKSFTENRPAGQATIEFIIDRDGRSRLPRVLEATAPEFGWAGAMAVSQWVFERPHRGGQPVDVTVRVPIAFKAPTQ